MGVIAKLDNHQVRLAYARWAPVYDLAFAAVMRAGRRAAAAAASRASLQNLDGRQADAPRGRVLDIGVGTGLELPMFETQTHVVGIDVSEVMLRRAMTRVCARRLNHVEGLLVMDATQLGFRDDTFDAVVAPFVMTVVPEPERTLEELARVVRPGGEIILVNHIGAEGGAVALIEAWLGRRSGALGWHPEFPWQVIGDWIARRDDMSLIERRPISPLGLFTLVRIGRAAATVGERVRAAS